MKKKLVLLFFILMTIITGYMTYTHPAESSLHLDMSFLDYRQGLSSYELWNQQDRTKVGVTLPHTDIQAPFINYDSEDIFIDLRDCTPSRHDYVFDLIVSDQPVRGLATYSSGSEEILDQYWLQDDIRINSGANPIPAPLFRRDSLKRAFAANGRGNVD